MERNGGAGSGVESGPAGGRGFRRWSGVEPGPVFTRVHVLPAPVATCPGPGREGCLGGEADGGPGADGAAEDDHPRRVPPQPLHRQVVRLPPVPVRVTTACCRSAGASAPTAASHARAGMRKAAPEPVTRVRA